MDYSIPISTSYIRPVDTRKDLPHVANLIETCFARHMDEEGREYLHHLRKAARDGSMIHSVQGSDEVITYPLHGYVWEQDRKIVGNLTLIPYKWHGEWIYMIVNVAVHPDYRRQGIARQLTLHGLEHIRDHHVHTAWLQVRSDNPEAINLYDALGFIQKTSRCTWISGGKTTPAQPDKNLKIKCSRGSDWPAISAWLNNIYPDEIAWNLGFQNERFNPGPLHRLVRFLVGDMLRQWSIYRDGSLIGAAAWEPTRQLTDTVWLALPPDFGDQPNSALLQHILNASYRNRKISINCPASTFERAFANCGFTLQNTLIWMEKKL